MTKQTDPEAIADDLLENAEGGTLQRTQQTITLDNGIKRKGVVLQIDEADGVQKPSSNWAVFEPNGER